MLEKTWTEKDTCIECGKEVSKGEEICEQCLLEADAWSLEGNYHDWFSDEGCK